MTPEAIAIQKKCKKLVKRAFLSILLMAEEIKKAKLTPKEELQIARNLEKYQAKVQKKYSPEDNAPF